MAVIFETNLQTYMHPSTAQRLGYEGLLNVLPKSFWRKHALWHLEVRDEYGHLTKEILSHNLILDTGAALMLKSAYGTSTTVAPFQYGALAQGTASTTLTAALSTSGPITSISVAALPAGSTLPNGTSVQIASGSNTQTVIINNSGGYSAGATSLTVNSFTPNFAYPAGSSVIPQPAFTDNPTALSGAIYTAIPNGSFSYAGGSGNGARTMNINNVSWTGSVAGTPSYTEIWLCNANPVSAAGQCGNHLTIASTPLAQNGTISYGFTERL